MCSHIQITYDLDQAAEDLKTFTFRDVVQGRVAIEETLSDSDNQLHINESRVTTARGNAPATPLNDSFTFLLKAGNVQPAKGELHFTIFPHRQMRHGSRISNKVDTSSSSHERTTTRFQTHNRTTTRGGQGTPVTESVARDGMQPHILSQRKQNKTQHKVKSHSRSGNHTRSGTHGGRSGIIPEGAGKGNSHTPQLHTPPVPETHTPMNHPNTELVHVQILPRPSSDPLLIILPLLACLLLIIILVVLILVFRHRKEKQARQQLMQGLAAVQLPTEDSLYLRRPERSMAMPNVMVTPLGSASCPTSPRIPMSPRRSLAPGMTFWGPFESDLLSGDGHIRDFDSNERNNNTFNSPTDTPAVFTWRSRSSIPSLKDNQYWV